MIERVATGALLAVARDRLILYLSKLKNFQRKES
jgi:hypothetical protein